MAKVIACWDERRDGYEEGEVLEVDVGVRRELRDEAVSAPPVEPELLARGPVSGFFMRRWGQGVNLTRMQQQRACPMPPHVHPGTSASSTDGASARSGATATCAGSSAWVGATHGGSSFQGGLSATADYVDLGALSGRGRLPSGGWVVGGASPLACSVEGYLGLRAARAGRFVLRRVVGVLAEREGAVSGGDFEEARALYLERLQLAPSFRVEWFEFREGPGLVWRAEVGEQSRAESYAGGTIPEPDRFLLILCYLLVHARESLRRILGVPDEAEEALKLAELHFGAGAIA